MNLNNLLPILDILVELMLAVSLRKILDSDSYFSGVFSCSFRLMLMVLIDNAPPSGLKGDKLRSCGVSDERRNQRMI